MRGANGWSTEYVGLPADLSPDRSSFSSALGGADAGLRTFAFAGPGLCEPCFSTSPETGIPLRKPDGQLVQGMVGTIRPEAPNLKPEGRVAKMLSADGRHLVFGSQYAARRRRQRLRRQSQHLRPRPVAGTTQLVSTTPAGTAMQAGMGVSELDLSDDGSRILIGTRVSEDAAGNEYVTLYMHLGSSPNTVELAPAATAGMLFDGMTADGSRVFFTSSQKLDGADTRRRPPTSTKPRSRRPAASSLSLLTTAGGSGPCNPVANGAGATGTRSARPRTAARSRSAAATGSRDSREPSTSSAPSSSAAARGRRTSPTSTSRPGTSPEFVATLSPDDPLVVDSVHAAAAAEGPEFETTPDGRFATFRSAAR